MGHVFLGKHQRMGREVAVKIFPIDSATSPRAVRRFQREVKATAALQHPNIVSAFDAGEVDDLLYIAMEYIDGWNLTTYVEEFGPLDFTKAIHFILQAARGLNHAHENNLIHRDVKPGNLLVDRNGHLKLLDLGLARFVDAASAKNLSVTSDSDLFAGSAEFMAPEQSLDFRAADKRSDIYSLGCTFHYLLTGKNIYPGVSTMQLIVAHREEAIPSLSKTTSDAPAELDIIFQKMVEKSPEDRYQSMASVVQVLEDFLREIGREDCIPQGESSEQAQSVSSLTHSLATKRSSDSESASRITMSEVAKPQTITTGIGYSLRRFAWPWGASIALAVLLLAVLLASQGFKPESPANEPIDVEAILSRRTPNIEWARLEPVRVRASHGALLKILDDQSILASGFNMANETYSVAYASPEEPIAAIKLDAMLDPSLPASGPGRSERGDFNIDAIRIYASDDSGVITPYQGNMHAFCDIQATSPTTNGVQGLVSPMVPTNWQMFRHEGQPNQAVLTLDPPLELSPKGQLVVQIQHRNYNDNTAANLGRFAISTTSTRYPYQDIHLVKAIKSGSITGNIAKAAALVLDDQPERAHGELQAEDKNSPDVHFLNAIALQQARNTAEARHSLAQLDGIRTYRNRICPELAQLEVLTRSEINDQSSLSAQREIWHVFARDTYNNLWTIDDTSHERQVYQLDQLANNRAIFGRLNESIDFHQELIKIEPERIFHYRRALVMAALANDLPRYQALFSQMVDKFSPQEGPEQRNSIVLIGLLLPEAVPFTSLPIEDFRKRVPVPEREINYESRIFALIAYREDKYEEAIRFARLPNQNAPIQVAIQSRIIEAMSLYKLGRQTEAEALLKTVDRSMPYPLLVSPIEDLPDNQLQMLSRWNLMETVALSAILLREFRGLMKGEVWRYDQETMLDWASLPELPFSNVDSLFTDPDQLASVGYWSKAANAYERLITEKKLPVDSLAQAGLLFAMDGDWDGYQRIREKIPQAVDESKLEAQLGLIQCYFCRATTNPEDETAKRLLQIAEKDLRRMVVADDPRAAYFRFACGLAAFRSGDLSTAQRHLDERCRSPISQWSLLDQAAGSVKALIELKRKNRGNADAIYAAMQPKIKQEGSQVGKGNEIDWLLSRLLFRELADRLADTSSNN